MTPAEIAALRERLAQYALDAERCQLSQGAADIRAALALLDAQEKNVTLLMRQTGFLQDDIRRLTAERERARADAIEEAARVAEWSHMVPPDGGSPTEAEHDVAKEAARRIRALAPAPAAEVAG